MRVCSAILWIGFLVAVCSAQDTDPANVGMYQSFFGQVAQLKRVDGPAMLNGVATAPLQDTRLEATGLNEAEQKILSEVATDCDSKIREVSAASGALIFEQRMQALESGNEDPSITRRLSELEAQRERLIHDHVERLKTLLSGPRFDVLDGYVKAHRGKPSFFPPVTAGPVPVKKL
jgi:hypothetical protein